MRVRTLAWARKGRERRGEARARWVGGWVVD